MRTIKLLKNTVQNYAWGSPSAIPELLGEQNPAQEPQAELWMGAHPKAPSFVYYDRRWLPLKELIAKYPQEILGKYVASVFDSKLLSISIIQECRNHAVYRGEGLPQG